MRVVALVCLVLALAVCAVQARELAESDYQQLFTNFVKKYNKDYAHDEFFSRFETFKANYDLIRTHNKSNSTYTLGVNEFADMTSKEFAARMLRLKPVDNAVLRSKNAFTGTPGFVAPTKVDWRTKGAVTPIKNQGQCGSCWAFSATGSMEGAHQISSGSLVSLSEQQLVDCSGAQGNQGCNGGLMDQAFQYVITNAGITTEDAYPYTAVDGTCVAAGKPVGATISSFHDVTAGSETVALLEAVTNAPTSIAIEADQSGFQLYQSGVFNGVCGQNLDHGVLLVGFDHDNGSNLDYWILKNSWGTSWGEQGYMQIVRGENECGLANMASYPVV